MKCRALLLLAIPLLLTACESRDVDLVLNFVDDWMMAKGILDEDGNPTLKAAGVVTGWSSTGDETVDAAVKAGAMLKDIEKTDKLAKEAESDMSKRPPEYDEAKKKLDAAIDARPEDWSYRNQRGALALVQGDTAAMQSDFTYAEQQCGGNQRCLDALYRDRDRHLFDAQLSQSKYINNPAGDNIFATSCTVLQEVIKNDQHILSTASGNDRIELQLNIDKKQADIRDGNCY